MIRRIEFDQQLDELRSLLQDMGKHMEEALANSVESLQTLDAEKAQAVIKNDVQLNNMEEQIMDIGSRLIVTQQPVAKDLRRILVAFRIASDLERMGDLARDVAKVTIRLQGQKLIKPLVDLPRMSDMVRAMVSESIESYLTENTDLAYKMAQDDDQVDHLYSVILQDLYSHLTSDPDSANQAMLLIMVGRYIERIADHATNIGESTVYLVTGHRPDLNQ
ncbi:phosphate transport system protein [Paenibacillus sp. cl141a]|jgi:phosphate transport system protein|uniref:phosphate signaling complex protein PhoU n=1 Tax=Bacillales TaxID=1385 RepID=UPI0001788F78|nr:MULTISPECIES: phosphate signaling complex protein PhoU [Paenibacillus]ACX67127.1 phosphate uptake regulator, PhoU [Paenibacillus sp. Y412MC10]ETT68615.1 phosphate uptake regulator PhoU [Paenibacillus sp. FSL H8-457]MCM3259580.1 phosphate signaling complex protein PhoU [Paenibacillus lautus]PCL90598.1 phosphate transport system regulatory protein PhoU [Paenibacillus lautus]QOT10719.1 phosphate signaling complex protein PhoU [Paenibacillus sp. JNUCC-32]